MLEQQVPAIKIDGIDQPIDVIVKVTAVTIADNSWSIAYQIYHPGTAKKIIKEGFTQIDSTMPEWTAFAKINAGLDTTFRAMVPAMLAKLENAKSG